MDNNDLRARLIREAVLLLGEGTADPSLREVARRAGVSAMAPYRHFADRAALMQAVAGEGFAALDERLQAADADPDDGAALVAQGLAYIAFALGHPALFRVMFGKPPAKPGAVRAPAYDTMARRARAAAPGAPEAATLACWATVHGLATLALDGRLPPDPDQARPVLALMVAGLRAGGAD